MTVEPARPSDHAAIAALNLRAYGEFEKHLTPDAWSRMSANITNIDERARWSEYLVIREGDGVVGAVAYAAPGDANDPEIFTCNMAGVFLLAVDPAHRGKGHGRALMAACLARARRDGAPTLGLFTSDLMQPAQALYRALGFVLDKTLPPRHGVTYVRYVLRVPDAEPA